LHDNQLNSILESIGNLSSLEELSLNNNQLKAIPDSIGKLKKLKGLNLYDNQLDSIPASIFDLQELEMLLVDLKLRDYLPKPKEGIRVDFIPYYIWYDNRSGL